MTLPGSGGMMASRLQFSGTKVEQMPAGPGGGACGRSVSLSVCPGRRRNVGTDREDTE